MIRTLLRSHLVVAASVALVCAAPSAHAAKGGKRGKPPPAAKVEPVRVRGVKVDALTLREGKKSSTVYVVTASNPLTLDLKGAGKLHLTLHQLLTPGAAGAAASANVSIDGRTIRTIALAGAPLRGATLSGSTNVPSAGKAQTEQLAAGDHTIEVTAPSVANGVALRIDFIPAGAKKPAPITTQAQGGGAGLMAAALALDDDEDEGDEAAPTPTPPPAESAPEEPAAETAPPPVETAATPVAEAEPEAAPAPPPPLKPLAERMDAGEVRDGLMQEYPEVTVAKVGADERGRFQRVEASQSYALLIAGPGTLTVRIHGLYDPAALVPGAEYSIIILQDDAVLQQLKAKTETTDDWQLEPADAAGGKQIAKPKEYRLTIGNGRPRIAFQIAQASAGMLARYTFEAEKAALSALSMSLDEDDEDGDVMAPPPTPTAIMEVDLSVGGERVIVEHEPSFLNLNLQVGAVLPAAGGSAAPTATLGLRFRAFAGAFSLGVNGGVQVSQLDVAVAESADSQIEASTQVIAVPVLGIISTRLELGEGAALFAGVGGGIVWERARRQMLDAERIATALTWAARASGGIELEAGPGWIGLTVAYLYSPTLDLDDVLRDYSPSGVALGLQYRLGG